jgi:hypothetical protein
MQQAGYTTQAQPVGGQYGTPSNYIGNSAGGGYPSNYGSSSHGTAQQVTQMQQSALTGQQQQQQQGDNTLNKLGGLAARVLSNMPPEQQSKLAQMGFGVQQGQQQMFTNQAYPQQQSYSQQSITGNQGIQQQQQQQQRQQQQQQQQQEATYAQPVVGAIGQNRMGMGMTIQQQPNKNMTVCLERFGVQVLVM